MNTSAQKMLSHLELLPELGKQRAFELGNPFYYQDAADANEPGNEARNFWRKELPSGELFLVTLQYEEINGETYLLKDTVIRQLR